MVDGRQFALGNHRLMEERKLHRTWESQLAVHESQGRTVTMLATSNAVVALFAAADTYQAVVQASRRGARGDGGRSHADGRQRCDGLDGRGSCWNQRRARQPTPEGKLNAIDAMQKEYSATAMTGDGINDAPARARPTLDSRWVAPGPTRPWRRLTLWS